MNLRVPLFKQPKYSQLCGPVCLQMLYSYYGIRLSLKQILRDIHMYKMGTFTSELGISLLRHGFDATLIFYDTRHFPPACRTWSRKKILHMIETMLRSKKKGKQRLRRTLAFLQEGGKLQFGIVTFNQIRNALAAGYPPILCIDSRALYGKKEGVAGHFVIPVTMTKNTITLNDPHSSYGGVKTYLLKDFLFALYSWRGYALFARPKKETL